MTKIKREHPNYLAIGIFLFVGIVLLVVGVVVSDKLFYKLKGGYPIYVLFDSVDGITVGSKMVIGGGKEVGQVDRIDLDGSRISLRILVDNKFKINRSATLEILSTSLMGGKILGVRNYTGQAPFIEANDRVEGLAPFSLGQIFSSLSGEEGGTNNNISSLVDSMKNVLSSADRIVGGNETNIAIAIANLTDASRRLNSLAANLDRKISSIDDAEFNKMMKDIELSLGELRIFLTDINKPDAPLSVLKDPAMNHSLRTIITNLEYTTERVKKQPSLLLRK